jgi:hypothetical protein
VSHVICITIPIRKKEKTRKKWKGEKKEDESGKRREGEKEKKCLVIVGFYDAITKSNTNNGFYIY